MILLLLALVRMVAAVAASDAELSYPLVDYSMALLSHYSVVMQPFACFLGFVDWNEHEDVIAKKAIMRMQIPCVLMQLILGLVNLFEVMIKFVEKKKVKDHDADVFHYYHLLLIVNEWKKRLILLWLILYDLL